MERKTKTPETQPATNEHPFPPERKPYHPPEVTSYGDLATVTQGAGITGDDATVGSLPG